MEHINAIIYLTALIFHLNIFYLCFGTDVLICNNINSVSWIAQSVQWLYYRPNDPGFKSQRGKVTSFFATMSRQALGSRQPVTDGYQELFPKSKEVEARGWPEPSS